MYICIVYFCSPILLFQPFMVDVEGWIAAIIAVVRMQ